MTEWARVTGASFKEIGRATAALHTSLLTFNFPALWRVLGLHAEPRDWSEWLHAAARLAVRDRSFFTACIAWRKAWALFKVEIATEAEARWNS